MAKFTPANATESELRGRIDAYETKAKVMIAEDDDGPDHSDSSYAGRSFEVTSLSSEVQGALVRAYETAGWADDWHDQVCVFAGERTTEHDDYVDSTSQAWRYMGDRFVTQGVTNKDDVAGRDERPLVREVRENPYAA